MENKWQTLQVIYDLVKNDSNPSKSIIHPNVIIARQNFPWDEIVEHLKELQTDGFVMLTQLSTAVVSLTNEGLQHMAARSVTAS